MPFAFRRLLWPKSLAGKARVVGVWLCAILVIAFTVALHYSSRRLEEGWKLSDELGLPNDVGSLLGPPIPDETNMAIPLEEAAAIATKHYQNVIKRTGINDDHTRITDPAYFAEYESFRHDAEYERWLCEAERRTDYRSLIQVHSPGDVDLSSLHQRCTATYPELCLAVHLRNRGECEEGLRRLLRISRLTRRWENKEPFFQGVLLNIAIRGRIIHEMNYLLRAAKGLPTKLHDDIEEEFQRCDAILDVLPPAIQMEKLSLMASYDADSPLGGVSLLRPLADNDRAYMLRFIHENARAAQEPFGEMRRRFNAMEADLRQRASDPFGKVAYAGAIKMLPAINSARTAFENLIARARCLRVVNAWRRKGDFALELERMELPPDCLVDPYDRKRLRVTRTPYGPIIYSVGWDLKDDGGKRAVGVGPFDMGLEPLELDIHGVMKK